MNDEQITQAARRICADQAAKSDTAEMSLYMSGGWDHTIWMRLVEDGIRKGIETERAAASDWFLKHNQRQLADSIIRAWLKETLESVQHNAASLYVHPEDAKTYKKDVKALKWLLYYIGED